MNGNSLANRSSLASLPPRLCGTVEGVEFWIASSKAQPIRCLITEAALQSHFGAQEFHDSWLSAFEQHRDDIERRAMAASAQRDNVHVVLLNDSLGCLKACSVYRRG